MQQKGSVNAAKAEPGFLMNSIHTTRISSLDSAVTAAASRARKPPASSRSRQQLQRERVLHLSVQKSAQLGTAALPPEQQLQQPLPSAKEEVQPAAGSGPAHPAPTVSPDEPQIQPNENHHVGAQEETPAVKELEQREAEVLVRPSILTQQYDDNFLC